MTGWSGASAARTVPATGISIGVSRLMAALQHLKKIDTQPEAGPVVVTVFDPDRIADYQKMVAALRSAGIRAELYLGSGKFGAQMKYADKRGSPCAVIQGGDEKAKGEVQIKDLILGATISSIKDRDEYKAEQAEGAVRGAGRSACRRRAQAARAAWRDVGVGAERRAPLLPACGERSAPSARAATSRSTSPSTLNLRCRSP